ncbi:MAG: integrase arm-type DNA-binding domain-containing protein [Deltaproteobacteria bacterium]|jgi:hypothetical protein|nr:integrase arm-type DNA-binding domain-containing protein [Deltaproteobacteria bacterium]
MPLTDTFLRNLKPEDKPVKHADMEGLYLYSTPTGLKSWRFDYRYEGKRQTMTFGTYPLLSLRQAREKLMDAKKTLQSGINPAMQKRAVKDAQATSSLGSFEVVAREWFERKKIGKVESYSSRIWGRVEKELLPFLADRRISEITAPELLEVLRKTEARGGVDTAHRCLQCCGQIFRYAIATGRLSHDISADLKGTLSPAIHGHMESLKGADEVGGLLRSIDAFSGNLIVKAALKTAPYVFVRPGELRHADWSEAV